MRLVAYTFKVERETRDGLPALAAKHGFTIPQLLRAVLARLADGRLTIEFQPEEGGNYKPGPQTEAHK